MERAEGGKWGGFSFARIEFGGILHKEMLLYGPSTSKHHGRFSRGLGPACIE